MRKTKLKLILARVSMNYFSFDFLNTGHLGEF